MAPYIQTDIEKDVPYVWHGFFDRSYDVRHGADKSGIAEESGLQPDNIVTLNQVHGDRVIHVTEPWEAKDQPEADALVTNIPGIGLGIKTADCAPILFADKKNKVIGAAHAGWRGALGSVIVRTIEAMEKIGAEPDHIVAAVGPCLCEDSFIVDQEFKDEFLNEILTNENFFMNVNESKHNFDFTGYLSWKIGLDVDDIRFAQGDTCSLEETYFSHRRATMRGTPEQEGRQISLIAIRENV